MTNQFKAPRGTSDVLPSEHPYWTLVVNSAKKIAGLFGYLRIETPIFEDASLFSRSVGEMSEVIDKQVYQFSDRGGDLMVLRPEGTAGVCRAYLQAGMHNASQPVRLWYIGPYFRYDRPQAGRMRQFSQVGFEAIGAMNASLDAEIIEMSWRFYEEIGLKGITLELNSIGHPECRKDYLKALCDYYQDQLSRICEYCRWRYEHNPLRLLDCKESKCQDVVEHASPISDYICDDCASHFQDLRGYLDHIGVPYQINPRLVRGLDYYTRTVFEISPPDVGSQSVIGAGGRYDGLIAELGGPSTPGVGFAAGIDRAILNIKDQKISVASQDPLVAFIAFQTEESNLVAYRLASELRKHGHSVVLATSGRSLKSQMRQANSSNALYALIIGQRELANKSVTVRSLNDGEEKVVPLLDVRRYLDEAKTG